MDKTDARLERERTLLQRVVAVVGLVPVGAGLYGVAFGAGLTGDTLSTAGDSHYRYLSGLLLGVGLLFWSAIPNIERHAGRFQVLTLVVVVGGLGRLAGLLLAGSPGLAMMGALVMELVVTPAICFWQYRVSRRYAVPVPAASRTPQQVDTVQPVPASAASAET